MKMNIEEKAKAYDEAYKVAENIHRFSSDPAEIKRMEEIFPELKESEDEKIRKNLLGYIKGVNEREVCKETLNEWIAWLEKQGKETNWKPSKEEMSVLYGLAYITNQYDEHKEEVITRLYQDLKREFFNGSSYENMFPNTEDGVRRRSTIQVLEYARSLDTYNQYGKADIDKNIAWLEGQGKNKSIDDLTQQEAMDITVAKCFNEQKPTDEEMRELLQTEYEKGRADAIAEMQKPAEWHREDEQNLNACLGFIPDAYLRRWLKDIIHVKYDKTAWSEEDEEHIKSLLERLEGMCKKGATFTMTRFAVSEDEYWLKHLKDRVQLKQEWSEEDERTYKSITYAFAHNYPLVVQQQEFVKSIKDRYTWKPSDEQIDALNKGRIYIPTTNIERKFIDSLLEDLKKLKG